MQEDGSCWNGELIRLEFVRSIEAKETMMECTGEGSLARWSCQNKTNEEREERYEIHGL